MQKVGICKKLEYAKSWYMQKVGICKILLCFFTEKVEFEFDKIACFVAPHVPLS